MGTYTIAVRRRGRLFFRCLRDESNKKQLGNFVPQVSERLTNIRRAINNSRHQPASVPGSSCPTFFFSAVPSLQTKPTECKNCFSSLSAFCSKVTTSRQCGSNEPGTNQTSRVLLVTQTRNRVRQCRARPSFVSCTAVVDARPRNSSLFLTVPRGRAKTNRARSCVWSC